MINRSPAFSMVCRCIITNFKITPRFYQYCHVSYLDHSFKRKHEEIRALLDLKINPNVCNEEGKSLLHISVRLANLQILDILLSCKDININIQNDKQKETSLFLAVSLQNFEAVNRLIQAGADVNILQVNNVTPVQMAIENNSLSILELLLYGKNVEVNRNNHESPLYIATKGGYYHLIVPLIEAGANIESLSLVCDEMPLEVALEHPKILNLFLARISDLNKTDQHGKTLLHKAVLKQNLESVCILLYYNIDVSIIDANEYTAFHYALQTRNEEIQDALFEYVADIIVDDKCTSYLQLALEFSSPYVDALLLRGAEVDHLSFQCLLTNWSFKEDVFKIVFDRLEDPQCLDKIIELDIDTDVLNKIFQIIVDSSNINIIIKYISACSDQEFLMDEIVRHCRPDPDVLAKLLFRLFEHSYVPNAEEIYLFYFHYGYCELLKLLRYIEYRDSWLSIIFHGTIMPRLIFDVHTPIKNIEKEYLKEFNLDLLEHKEYKCRIEHYFGFFANKELMIRCGFKFSENVLPTVPKLVELARNASREFVVKAFNVTSTCLYYTIIDHCLKISSVCKAILKFERKLYFICL